MTTHTLEIQCLFCKTMHSVTVEHSAFVLWTKGFALIQDAFPHLTASERDLLTSQTCDDCWNRMFRDE